MCNNWLLLGEYRTLWGKREQAIYQWSTVKSRCQVTAHSLRYPPKQGLSAYCLQSGTVTTAENAWLVIEFSCSGDIWESPYINHKAESVAFCVKHVYTQLSAHVYIQ